METKVCSGECKRSLPATEEFFATKKLKTKSILQWQCRDCQKRYRKTHYTNNKQKYIDKAAAYKVVVKTWFNEEIKKKLCCINCGESRPWVLDFHHRVPGEKEKSVATMVNSGTKRKLLLEMEKCDVLCSNCHRDLHYNERI